MDLFSDSKFGFFSNLLKCGQPLFYWSYNIDLELIATSCPQPEIYQGYFQLSNCKEYLNDYVSKGNYLPLILSNALGLSWIAAMERTESLIKRVHLIGPAFTADLSSAAIEETMKHMNYSAKLKHHFTNQLRELPIISMSTWFQYGLMLHFCATGDYLQISDYQFQPSTEISTPPSEEDSPNSAKYGTWMAEEMVMKMIEDGCLEYEEALNKLSSNTHNLSMETKQLAQQYRTYLNTFISLCTRASIRGGLDPESAYMVGDYYIRQAEKASTFSDANFLKKTMYADFVHRVHKIKTEDGISQPIRMCCHYIEMHVTEKFELQTLADKVGYSAYYLGKLFKKEMGCSINEYVKKAKINHAKTLLLSSTQNIQDISDTLHFCSQSHFTETFRKIVGTTPSEFRSHTKL